MIEITVFLWTKNIILSCPSLRGHIETTSGDLVTPLTHTIHPPPPLTIFFLRQQYTNSLSRNPGIVLRLKLSRRSRYFCFLRIPLIRRNPDSAAKKWLQQSRNHHPLSFFSFSVYRSPRPSTWWSMWIFRPNLTSFVKTSNPPPPCFYTIQIINTGTHLHVPNWIISCFFKYKLQKHPPPYNHLCYL